MIILYYEKDTKKNKKIKEISFSLKLNKYEKKK